MRSATTGDVNISITRMGHVTKEVSLSEDATVEDALDAAGIELTSSEKAFVGEEKAEMNDMLDDGDVLSIVGKKEGGLK